MPETESLLDETPGTERPFPRSLLYVVELWSVDGTRVERCLAAAATISIGRMAFDAAVVTFPGRTLTGPACRRSGVRRRSVSPHAGRGAGGRTIRNASRCCGRRRDGPPSPCGEAVVSPSEASTPEVAPSGAGLSEIERAASRYLDAARGDRDEALRLVIADLLRSEDETAVAVVALDRWISYGYVRGRATGTLRRGSRPPVG